MPLVIIPLRNDRSAAIHPFEALRDVLFDPVPHEPARAAVHGLDLLAEDPQHYVEVADVACFARLGGAHGLPRRPLRLTGGDLGQSRRSLCGRRRRLDRCALLPRRLLEFERVRQPFI
jgi:hypothetical protein